MVKDRALKQLALRYAATRRWYPHLEVEVSPPSRVARKVSLLTDIDVLSVAPDPVLGNQTVLFDCKTKAGESGINRSLWLKGLMAHFNAEHGFCVLKKASIDSDHREVAKNLGVVLIPEDEFELFGKVSAGQELVADAAIADLSVWESVAALKARFPKIEPLLSYRSGDFWRSRADHSGCRKAVANVLEYRAEFDPAHIDHQVLFGDLVSLFALSLSSLVVDIFKIMLLPASSADFEDAIKMKLYGGRDSYDQQNKLFRLIKEARHGGVPIDDLSPPEWGRFVKLIRQLLDDPNAVVRAALILKEVAFSMATKKVSFLNVLALNDRQAVRFAILINDYFSRATKVPPEFKDAVEKPLLVVA